MASKNSLDAYKSVSKKSVLKKKSEPKKIKPAKATGRPIKPAAEKENYRINFNLTQAQGKLLEEKAGISSVNVFVKHFLKNNTDLLK